MYQNKISGSIVIIDGSNVAMYGMSKTGKKKAKIENIMAVINKLKEYKASEIITICDANIRYTIDDKDKLDSMIEDKSVILAPSGIRADMFILDYARQKNCLIVSNDKFRDYRSDKWINDNVDSITLGFIFVGKDVLLEPVNHKSMIFDTKSKKEITKWWHFFKKKQ
jgi:hypothetical protein